MVAQLNIFPIFITGVFHQYDTIIYPYEGQPTSEGIEKLTKDFIRALKVKVGKYKHQFTPKVPEAMRKECLKAYLERHEDTIVRSESQTDGGIDKTVSAIVGTYQGLHTQWVHYPQERSFDAWPVPAVLDVSLWWT